MSGSERVRLSEFGGIPSDPPSENGGLNWKPLGAGAFLDLPEPEGVELLGPLVTRGGRTLVGGDSGHGKTTLAFAMTSAVLKGTELLGFEGAGDGPALVIDLEQGVRSIKRGIRASGLADADVYLLNLPDGLALDQNPEELVHLTDVIGGLNPVLIVLDPYYKAHRGDANEERGVTDLMRKLDRLRTDFGFALLMPAHVRKDPLTAAARKLTLADIAGSGAISRGAEVVIGIERLAHGHARLRYLKDRDGDLPVGDAVNLTFSAESGFAVVEEPAEQSIEQQILDVESSEWLTVTEWATKLALRQSDVRRVLTRLAVTEQIAYMKGPPGRSSSAKCYSTATDPLFRDEPGSVGRPAGPGVGDPTDPDHPRKGVGRDHTQSRPNPADSTDPDDDLPSFR